LQETQGPLQSVLQQTPSKQFFERQSAPVLHGPRPVGRGPHLPSGPHATSVAQSVSLVQLERQAVGPAQL
jgi:hypothetical protein